DEGVRVVTGPPPVRVEKALALMPELEALAPLRALLVSIARPDEATVWSSSGPYLTLGKRGVHPDELRRRMPQAFQRITEHLQALFKAYVEALECQQRADAPGVVLALLGAGRLEEDVGRHTQARTWSEVALGAQAWYSRGLRLAEAASDAPRAGRLERQLGVLARKQRDLAAAGDLLRRARERFEAAGLADEMAGVLNEQGRLDAHLGRYTAASAADREALACAKRVPRDARLELSIRSNLAVVDPAAGP